MADQVEQRETVSFRELLIANMVEIQALAQLLMEKGIIGEQEYVAKLKQVQGEYQKRQGS